MVQVELYGLDGTQDLIHGKLEDMPEDYIDRGEVVVNIDDDTFDKIQEVYLDQMEQLAWMMKDYPHLIGGIEVDGEDTLSARIFNTPDGEPNIDFKVMQDPKVGFVQPALRA